MPSLTPTVRDRVNQIRQLGSDTITDPITGQKRALTAAEISDRARSQGAAIGASESSAAAGAVGMEQERAQAGAMATASAYKPPVMPTPLPAPKSTSDQIYDSALSQIANGINSDQPTPGTAAAIRANREALATYARSTEARAGAAAAGSEGQGTARAMGQAARQDILGQLAQGEMANTQLVADEKQKFLNLGVQAGQFGQSTALEKERMETQKSQFDTTTSTQKEQFDKTFEQSKTEFDRTFGLQQGQDYRNTLERLAQENPVLATKLTNYLLEGKTGPVGSFTAEEMQQMKEYASKKTTQDDKLTEVYNKILESVPGQIATQQKTEADANAEADKAKQISAAKELLANGGALTSEQTSLLVGSGDIAPVTSLQNRDVAKANVGKTMSLGDGLVGKVTQVVYSDLHKTTSIYLDVNGKTLIYDPDRNEFHGSRGGKKADVISKSAKEAYEGIG